MAVVDATDAPVRPAKVAFASFIGTTIEWYDFFIFGTAAALIFGPAFFPGFSPLAGILASFGTFGVAFVSRPLGAIVFGHYGDRIGRKKMLVASLLLMGSATVLIGLLPTYDKIGVAAPILLVIARLLQGFAVGGEWGGAVLMAVEHAPPSKKAFYGSWPQAGVPGGLVLSTLAFLAVQLLPDGQFESWGWRIPFLASSVLIAAGLYVRVKVVESPEFEKMKKGGKIAKFPILEVLKTQRKPLFIAIMTQAAAFAPFYIVSVFIFTYGPKVLGIPRETILLSLLVAAALDVIALPYSAIIADRIGARKMLVYGSVYVAVIAYPFFYLLQIATGWSVLLAMILAITVGHAWTYGAVAGYVTGLFPAEFRYTGASVGYQFAGIVFSAPAPFIATAIASATDNLLGLSAYFASGAVLTFIALTCFKTAKVNFGASS